MHEALITIADTKIELTLERLGDAHEDISHLERQVASAQDNLEKARLEVTRLNAELDSLRASKQYLLEDDFAEPEPEVPLTPLVPAEPESDDEWDIDEMAPEPEVVAEQVPSISDPDWREQIGH